MGLNDTELESLSSITASEFFEVTITGTNSPIQQGDTLTVEYDVTNTGDVTGTQDITLEIDTVVEDTDSGVRVLANRTGSGTLEWVTAADETAQDYTATLLSADDSASQTVTVESGSAIPDSVTNQWRMGEGSGSTLNDNVGSETATLNGPTWVSDPSGTGDYWISLDGTDDWWVTDNAIGINGQQYAVCGWFKMDSGTSDFSTVVSSAGQSSASWSAFRNDTGWVIQKDSSSDALAFAHYPGGKFWSVSISYDTWYFYGLSGDGDSADAYLWDNSQLVNSTSATSNRDGVGSGHYLRGGVDDSNYVTGEEDVVSVSTNSTMTQSEFEQIWEDTKR